MSDFTHARICIRHASGSVEVDAPAGETVSLDLSGLHGRPVTGGKRRGGGRLVAAALAGCVFGGAVALAWARPAPPVLAAWDRPSDLPVGVPPAANPLPPSPLPSAAPPAPGGGDPFGLRLR